MALEVTRAASYYDRGSLSLGTPTAQDYGNAVGYDLALVGVGALVIGYFVWRAVRPRGATRAGG